MNTKTATLAMLATISAVAFSANAQMQERNRQPIRQPAGFKCPVCGSPCISKAEITKQHRPRLQANARQQQFGPDRAPQARRHQAAMGAGANEPAAKPLRNRQQRQLRFDINRDGTLSPAERAARKAYRDALAATDEAPRADRTQRPPIEE